MPDKTTRDWNRLRFKGNWITVQRQLNHSPKAMELVLFLPRCIAASLLALIVALLLTSCHDDLPMPETIYRQVVVVYMAADNNLDYNGFSSSDLAEIRSARNLIPEDCRFVVFMDKYNSSQLPCIINLSRDTETNLYTYAEELASTDSTVMRNALRFIAEQLPAEHYSLILWSHASGWLPQKRKTFGVDNHLGTTSTHSEMELSALHWALQGTGVHWDWVFSDACFMQCAEVAYELRDVTDWTIGSPAEIPGNGAPYDVLMSGFFAENAPQEIVEGYYNHYKDNDGVLISAVKTNEMEALRNMTRYCIDTLQTQPTCDVLHYCTDKDYTEFYDMNDGMFHWFSSTDYAKWLAVFNKAVPYRRCTTHWLSLHHDTTYPTVSDPEHFGGISIYVPHPERTTLNEAARRTAFWR